MLFISNFANFPGRTSLRSYRLRRLYLCHYLRPTLEDPLHRFCFLRDDLMCGSIDWLTAHDVSRTDPETHDYYLYGNL